MSSFAVFGALSAVVQTFSIVEPDALKGNGWVLIGMATIALLIGRILSRSKPISQKFYSPSTLIRVVSGDLFDQSGHLVIGTCDTFDTAPPYIAPESVQGQFAAREWGGDLASLDAQISAALVSHTPTESVMKDGKQTRYPLGTVVTLRSQARRYFLSAYTQMDERNSAHGSIDGFWRALMALWAEVRIESNGTEVCIPPIGGGQSKMSRILPVQDSIRFVAMSFILASRTEPVCGELTIVVRPSEYQTLDHRELQAFLASLRAS